MSSRAYAKQVSSVRFHALLWAQPPPLNCFEWSWESGYMSSLITWKRTGTDGPYTDEQWKCFKGAILGGAVKFGREGSWRSWSRLWRVGRSVLQGWGLGGAPRARWSGCLPSGQRVSQHQKRELEILPARGWLCWWLPQSQSVGKSNAETTGRGWQMNPEKCDWESSLTSGLRMSSSLRVKVSSWNSGTLRPLG